jgi:hypothetical protein
MNPDRHAAIAARAHQIWQEAGRPDGQDAEHWHRAEQEHGEAEARSAAVEQFNAEPAGARRATPARKRVAKAVEPSDAVPAAPARKPRAPRKPPAAAPTH